MKKCTKNNPQFSPQLSSSQPWCCPAQRLVPMKSLLSWLRWPRWMGWAGRSPLYHPVLNEGTGCSLTAHSSLGIWCNCSDESWGCGKNELGPGVLSESPACSSAPQACLLLPQRAGLERQGRYPDFLLGDHQSPKALSGLVSQVSLPLGVCLVVGQLTECAKPWTEGIV